MKKIFCLIVICLFIFSSCSNIKHNSKEEISIEAEDKKIIATWVTYQEIKDLVDSSNSEKDFELAIHEMVNTLKKYSINVIFLHVRAFDDCFYKSNIYPVSMYCAKQNGSLKFDVLQKFINICKPLGVEVHAWINPYRIRNDNDIDKISKNSLSYKYVKDGLKEKLIVTDNCIYYNPAYLEIQKYILDGLREILNNYDIDGIHIDDYFYPTTAENIDKENYNAYKETGGILKLEDYRRQCINSLVSSIYALVKDFDENICFTISPSSDIDKNYNSHYADVNKWLTQNGYADYIIPQIYYGYENEDMPFKDTLLKWTSINSSKLIIGLGIYKSGKKDVYAKSGEGEWLNNSDIISKQIIDVINNNLNGYSIYSSSFLMRNTNNLVLESEKENIIKIMEIYET